MPPRRRLTTHRPDSRTTRPRATRRLRTALRHPPLRTAATRLRTPQAAHHQEQRRRRMGQQCCHGRQVPHRQWHRVATPDTPLRLMRQLLERRRRRSPPWHSRKQWLPAAALRRRLPQPAAALGRRWCLPRLLRRQRRRLGHTAPRLGRTAQGGRLRTRQQGRRQRQGQRQRPTGRQRTGRTTTARRTADRPSASFGKPERGSRWGWMPLRLQLWAVSGTGSAPSQSHCTGQQGNLHNPSWVLLC